MRIVTLGDIQLEVWEAGSGPAVLFIHGVATSGELWAADLAELAADRRLIVYNRRGYGTSSPSPRDWRAHADDAAALIEKLGAAPAAVVGYSGGAIVALDLVLRRPDLFSRLILLDPAVNLTRCLTPGLVRTLAVVKLLRWLRRDRAAAERWLRHVSSYPTGRCAFEHKASGVRREQLLANADGLFADLASGGGTIDERLLDGIRVPVTLVDAGSSPPFLRRSSLRLRRMMPRARSVTIADSGHWIALDAHDDLLEILRDAAR